MGRAAKIVAVNLCVFIGLYFAIMLIVSVFRRPRSCCEVCRWVWRQSRKR